VIARRVACSVAPASSRCVVSCTCAQPTTCIDGVNAMWCCLCGGGCGWHATQVNGQRCVVTIGQRKDGTGVMVRVFHPATEKQHELSLSHEQIRETLPDDLLGDENEIEQLKYIRDKCVRCGVLAAAGLTGETFVMCGGGPASTLSAAPLTRGIVRCCSQQSSSDWTRGFTASRIAASRWAAPPCPAS